MGDAARRSVGIALVGSFTDVELVAAFVRTESDVAFADVKVVGVDVARTLPAAVTAAFNSKSLNTRIYFEIVKLLVGQSSGPIPQVQASEPQGQRGLPPPLKPIPSLTFEAVVDVRSSYSVDTVRNNLVPNSCPYNFLLP